jgi:glucosamine--fructose-6-phosphate aminotransferase (isomerizing)
MSTIAIEEDIRSTPAIVRQTQARVDERRAALAPLLGGPMALLGSGSSYCVALSAAATYEQARRAPAQAIIASDYLPRPGWTHVAISRTGQTTELIEAMARARAAGAPVLLVVGEDGSPAARHADAVLPLEFASEKGVIQTRFVAASIAALRSLATGDASPDLPRHIARAIEDFDPTPLLRFDHVVFLGRGAAYGIARAAAVNLQETALLAPEAHQTLDYRHGPIAAADDRTLVWSLDPPEDTESAAVLDDVRATGATVRGGEDEPLATLAQVQLLSLHKAAARGIDPTAPRNLARAVILDR